MAAGQGTNVPRTVGYDIREMSFQNVIEKVLKPSGVKVGGFPEELFLDLTDEEKEKYTCNICYMILNDSRECDNKHLFCNTCVLAWSMTYGENSLKCPFCRCDQIEYLPNAGVDETLGQKRVRCMEKGCAFQSPLRIFLMHGHGKLLYSNVGIDFEALRYHGQAEASSTRFSIGPDNTNRNISPGGWMLSQMMILMHLEGQLRQHSLLLLESAAQDASNESEGPNEVRENREQHRAQRLGDIIALNEQLNEVGSLLSAFLGAPMRRAGSQAAQSMISGVTSSLGLESRLGGNASSEDDMVTTPESFARFSNSRASPVPRVVESDAGRGSSESSAGYMGASQHRNLERYYDFDTGGEPIDWEVRSDVTLTTESDVTAIQSGTDQSSERLLTGTSVSSSTSYGQLSLSNPSEHSYSSQRGRYGLELDADEDDRYFFNRSRRLARNESSTGTERDSVSSRMSSSLLLSDQPNGRSTRDRLAVDSVNDNSAFDYRNRPTSRLLPASRDPPAASVATQRTDPFWSFRSFQSDPQPVNTSRNDAASQTSYARRNTEVNDANDSHANGDNDYVDYNDVDSSRFNTRNMSQDSTYTSASRFLHRDVQESGHSNMRQSSGGDVIGVSVGVIHQRRGSISVTQSPMATAVASASLALPSLTGASTGHWTLDTSLTGASTGHLGLRSPSLLRESHLLSVRGPVASSHSLVSGPVASSHSFVSGPVVSSHSLISGPVVSSHSLVSGPVASSHSLVSGPVASSHSLVSGPVASSHSLVSDPVTSSHSLISGPVASSRSLISGPVASTHSLVSGSSSRDTPGGENPCGSTVTGRNKVIASSLRIEISSSERPQRNVNESCATVSQPPNGVASNTSDEHEGLESCEAPLTLTSSRNIDSVEAEMYLPALASNNRETSSVLAVTVGSASNGEYSRETVEANEEQSAVAAEEQSSSGPLIVPVLDRASLELYEDTSGMPRLRRQSEISSNSYETNASRDRRKSKQIPNRGSTKVKNISLEFPTQRQSSLGGAGNTRPIDRREGSVVSVTHVRDTSRPQMFGGTASHNQSQAPLAGRANRTRYGRDAQNLSGGGNHLPPTAAAIKPRAVDAAKASNTTSGPSRLSDLSGTLKPLVSRSKPLSDKRALNRNNKK